MAGLTFTGIASGVDTDAIVTSLMALERRPVDRLQRSADLASARLAGLADVRTRLGTLRGAEQALRAAGAFALKPVATTSDAARVGATATASAVKGSFSVSVTALARADVRTQGSSLTAAAADDVLHVGSGGVTSDVAISAGDTVAIIAGKINAANGPVAASVVDGRLRLTAKGAGAANTVSLSSSGALAGGLGMTVTLAGQDAQFSVDGVAGSSATNRVTDAIPGVTLDLRATTGSNPVTIVADPAALDADDIVARAKAFVSAYNDVVGVLRGAIGERPEAGGTGPVAKGAFFGDGLYTDVLARLRRAVQDPVSGLPSTRNQAASIGITGGALSGAMSADALSGRLVLDEAKLRDALATDPDGVAALLGGDGPQGLAARVDAVLDGVTGGGGPLGGRVAAETARLTGYRSSIADANERLTRREALLRTQFTAMERALGQLHDLQSRLGMQLDAAA